MADEETIRCRKCRKILITDFATLINAHGDRYQGGKTGDNEIVNECVADSERSCLYIAEDSYPEFVTEAVDESSWTKGKLNCPGCQARIGSFNFISGSHCVCGAIIVPQVHLLVSKVDVRKAKEALPQPVSYPDRPVALSAADVESLPILISTGSSTDSNSKAGDSVSPAASLQLCNDDDTLGATSSGALQQQYSVENTDLEAIASSSSESGALKKRKRLEKKQHSDIDADSDVAVSGLKSSNFHVLASEESEETLKDSLSEDDGRRNKRCEDIPQHLTCSVCLDLLYSPFIAQPCSHVFCEPCLRRLARPNPTKTLCPLCRQMIGQCMPSKDLGAEVRQKYPDLYNERHQFEQKHNIQHIPLPWLRDFRMRQLTTNGRSLVQMAGGWKPILWMLTGNILGFGCLAVLRWYLKSQRMEQASEMLQNGGGIDLD